ncbi:MAG TPA: 50S ribosomal protein L11 methyltransferase [Pyrinomonadaceae bacterium]|nr:50S ribosomal protein L11 methyltransferase [Pyrinomonadaceae bacterium]
MYSLHFYGRMIAGGPRMDAYAAALHHTIKPDSVVMDLGCGPGVFALLACKLGARRVYAVEPESVIAIAREAAAANGYADQIEFFEEFSTRINLPEPATIIVSDLRGVLPWFQQHIPAIIDARQRLLARGGTLIPRRDVLWAAVVESANAYEEIVGPWEGNGFDLDLSAGTRRVTNTWRKTRIEPAELLTDPICWTTIDYYEVNSPDIRAEISWRAGRKGSAHGIAVWFDTVLVDGIGFSNHPNEPELIYGNGLFPFVKPVEVMEGERISVRLTAKMVEDNYVWCWDTDVFSRDDETRPKVSFKQSTFFGVPLSAEKLRELRQ